MSYRHLTEDRLVEWAACQPCVEWTDYLALGDCGGCVPCLARKDQRENDDERDRRRDQRLDDEADRAPRPART